MVFPVICSTFCKQQCVKIKLTVLSRVVHNFSPSPLTQIPAEKKCIDPHDVGIIEFIGTHPRLKATVKDNYSFHVNEIDVTGRIVRLTSLSPPPSIAQISDGSGKPKEEEKKYIHCTLYKNRIGMAEAMYSIAKKLRINPNSLQWAGRKDRNAKTSQRISIEDVEAHRLIKISSESKVVKLGNFVYSSQPLSIGQLRGNHFKLLLRNVQVENSSDENLVCGAMEEAMKSFKKVGYINYFGLQRFGNFPDVPTFVIGIAVLQMEWERVFDLILTPKPRDSDAMVEAKKLWFSERDPVKIEKFLKKKRIHLIDEPTLLKGLFIYYKGGKGDLAAAYHYIPKSIRSLHIPALMSFIWNHMATFRIQKFGLVPIPGDFVYTVPPFESTSLTSAEPFDVNIEYSPSKCGWQWEKVKVLTKEDIASGQYSIYDVLLLLPGSKISTYSNPVLQSYYEKFLLDLGLDTDCFAKFAKRYSTYKGTFHQSNQHRPIVKIPQNVDYTLIPYNDSDDCAKFIPSDWDLLSDDHQVTSPYQSTSGKNGIPNVKDKMCAIVEFSLPTSSYATMALREVLVNSPNI